MIQRRNQIAALRRRIERLSPAEQCELLEEILLRNRPQELDDRVDHIRAKLPKRSEREVKRDTDKAIALVRRRGLAKKHRL